MNDWDVVQVTEMLEDAGLQDTFWGKRIIEAAERGEFTKKDDYGSSSWVTCACGKCSTKIEKEDWSNEPKDFELNRLGRRFGIYASSYNGSAYKAAETLVAIERRAAALLGAK